MAYLTLGDQLRARGGDYPRGIGYAEIIAGILGPLAEGGAVAYSTYSQEKLAKKELKARQIEVNQALALKAQEDEARRRLDAEQLEVDRVQGQIRSYLTADNLKVAIAGVVLLGVTAVVAKTVSGALRRNPRRRRGGRRGRR